MLLRRNLASAIDSDKSSGTISGMEISEARSFSFYGLVVFMNNK